ncbi:Ktr system potassium uptake protein D [Desulfuribacillus stibiiarsenatis]|uniref:Ktr system potassium uptake protein D n=1 Tax=Desulfuribacillus stibiiarsenatis TaxID=1390249 RepID=A0A1E5L8B9_9FIRM|nr:potassium transporter TrkG [Desulfuribacillus stibiiarsenatis]OEH86193.1 Ktr system potassium uptake protein D [Desulfuribacillus stibiiarsenatis]
MRITIPLYKKIELTAAQLIVFIYTLAIAISSSLLSLPWAKQPGVEMNFVDLLFTTVSAITVTGLTVANTAETFTPFGTTIIAMLLQIGGVGVMTLWTFIWLIFGKKIGLGYRQLIMIDQNRDQLTGLVKVIQLVFGFAIAIELLGVLFFTSIFYFRGYYPELSQAFYHGFFHSISAYTNGGFDIFGNSLQSFYQDYLVQTGTIVLIILGAIGFPVLIEGWSYAVAKKNKEKFRFSLYTKVTLLTFVILLVIGTIGIFFMEHQGYIKDAPWHEKLFFSLFNSVTARSGGLSTMDVSQMFVPTLLFLSVLMFIGASPSSVGGGIRTTTFATVILTIRTYARGRKNVHVFGRRLDEADILKSFVVFTFGVLLIVTSILIIDFLEMHQHSLVSVIFEVTSAFGTCGLSTGITPDLTNISKFILMGLMFIGRIGILAFLVSMSVDHGHANIKYPVEKIIIG